MNRAHLRTVRIGRRTRVFKFIHDKEARKYRVWMEGSDIFLVIWPVAVRTQPYSDGQRRIHRTWFASRHQHNGRGQPSTDLGIISGGHTARAAFLDAALETWK